MLAPVVWLGLQEILVHALFRLVVVVDEIQTATQPLEAPGAGTATQPVQGPGSVPDELPSGTGDVDFNAD